MQKAGGPILTIYTSYDMFRRRKLLPFGVAMTAFVLKNFTDVNFLIPTNSLTLISALTAIVFTHMQH